jgi:hypothetical protein
LLFLRRLALGIERALDQYPQRFSARWNCRLLPAPVFQAVKKALVYAGKDRDKHRPGSLRFGETGLRRIGASENSTNEPREMS